MSATQAPASTTLGPWAANWPKLSRCAPISARFGPGPGERCLPWWRGRQGERRWSSAASQSHRRRGRAICPPGAEGLHKVFGRTDAAGAQRIRCRGLNHVFMAARPQRGRARREDSRMQAGRALPGGRSGIRFRARCELVKQCCGTGVGCFSGARPHVSPSWRRHALCPTRARPQGPSANVTHLRGRFAIASFRCACGRSMQPTMVAEHVVGLCSGSSRRAQS